MKKNYIVLVIFIASMSCALNVGAQYSWTKKANFPGTARYYDAGFSIGGYGFIGSGEQNPYNSQYFDWYKWKKSTNTWSQIAGYPGTGTASPVCTSIEGYGYVGLGFDVISQQAQTDFYRYDTTSDTWTAMATFPGPGRYDASWFVIGHKLYVIGGSVGGPPYLNDAWVYDAHQNTWTQLGNSPANSVDNMVSFAIGNHGYIAGGYDDDFSYTNAWRYDTTADSWTVIANIPGPVYQQPRSFVLGSKGFACMGVRSDINEVADGYCYDTVKQAWSVFTNMGNHGLERRSGAAFAIGNCGYIGTGEDSLGNMLTSFWQYGPDTVQTCVYWTQKANFPGTARYYDAGFSIGKYGFIGNGEQNPYDSQYFDWYKWSQASNTWSQIANYPGTGVASPVCASIEGYGYVGLGFNVITQTPQTDLWRYDTTNNTWSAMASFPGAGRYDASWFVIGHKLYVIGGSVGGPPYLNDAWVYDAHQNTWKQIGNSPANNVDNMVAFAIGNHGYIAGGYDDNFSYTNAWRYDTTADSWTVIANIPGPVYQQPRSFVLGSKGFACMGVRSDINEVADGYCYDTVTQAWSVFTNMGSQGIERRSGAAFTIGNYGYIGTGEDSLGNMLNTFWQYYPCDGDSTSGLEQVASLNDNVSIYPNPTLNTIFVKVKLAVNDISGWNIELVDVTGRVLYNKTSVSYNNEIDLSSLPPAMYFVVVKTKTERNAFSVVKQ